MCAHISLDFGQCLSKIWDAAAGELKHLRRPKPRIEQLKEASHELETKKSDIDSRISQAERQRQIPTNQIELWLHKVNGMKDIIETIENDFGRMRCLCGWSWNCFSVNRRVDKSMEEIKTLMTRVDDYTQVAIEPPPLRVVQIPTSSSTLAMDENKKKILKHIASINAGVIGIYGMGGVGKTTLLHSINHHSSVVVFDYVIWVVASKECRMERLQKDIAERLGLQLKEHDTEEGRASQLYDFLNNKDCLLLLDDLWEPLNLAKLGMVHVLSGQAEQQKRKVVVLTTRSEQVCCEMNASTKMEIKCLETEQAWELFRRNTGEDAVGSDPGIDHIARQIAKECAGLPLALITVGKAMSSKKTWAAWNNALTKMRQSLMPDVTGKKEADPMYSAFKLSYDSLEDDNMRGRLLSCAMWPEDHSIKKNKLIECWMGLGLIDEEGAIYKAYDSGHSHIETLKAVCLLEPGKYERSQVKMHDVIRDMALWMASDCGKKKSKWIVRAGDAVSQAFEEERWEETDRASLMYNDLVSLPNQLPSTSSNLSVLMLQKNKLKEIPGSLIQAMHALTYLDLERTRIIKIPREIGKLSQLKYLNLGFTRITELPTELGSLNKLNYLLLAYAIYLSTVANGAISNLSLLRFLDLRGIKHMICWDELEGLQGCQKSIGISIRTQAALQCLWSLPQVSIWALEVESLEDSTKLNELLDDIMKSCNARRTMERLRISFVGMNELLISVRNEEAGGFECLKLLELSYLKKLEKIAWKGVQPQIVFPNLRKLKIVRCNRLRNINWTMQLPCLSVLVVASCWAMEELISDEGGTMSFRLNIMELIDMDKLKRISLRPMDLPYLEEIAVSRCPLLVKLLSENQIYVNKLKVIRCQQTWWNNLEWEDVSLKHALSPLLTEYSPSPLSDEIEA